MFRKSLRLYCPMDLRKFPMDQQICEMVFESCKYFNTYKILLFHIYIQNCHSNVVAILVVSTIVLRVLPGTRITHKRSSFPFLKPMVRYCFNVAPSACITLIQPNRRSERDCLCFKFLGLRRKPEVHVLRTSCFGLRQNSRSLALANDRNFRDENAVTISCVRESVI